MTWNANTPRGDLLPVDERPRFTGNWDYIETQMQDDHFFDEDANRDGHHKKVEMANLTDGIGSGNVDSNGDPSALSTSMTGMFYMRPKTSTEAPETANRLTQPYYMVTDGGAPALNQIHQLGMNAMATFRVASSAITLNDGNDWDYQHNIATIVRSTAGRFNVTFTVNMPTNRYLVIGTIESDQTAASFSVANGTKAVTGFSFRTSRDGGSAQDPKSVSFIVIGG